MTFAAFFLSWHIVKDACKYPFSSFLQGNVTFSCSPPQLVACTFLSSSSSFLSLPSAATLTGEFTVRFQFRTWNPDGLLLSVQLNPSPQKIELQISNSWLHLTLHSTGRQRSEVSAGECEQPTLSKYQLNLFSTVFRILLIFIGENYQIKFPFRTWGF